jgi:hypothetical protein
MVSGSYNQTVDSAFTTRPKAIYKDPRGSGQVIAGYGHPLSSAHRFWECIYFGVINGVSSYTSLTAGSLKAAPSGLGFLVSSGYVADAATLWCPTGREAPVQDSKCTLSNGMFISGEGWGAYFMNQARHLPEHVQDLGGFTSASLTNGDYSKRVRVPHGGTVYDPNVWNNYNGGPTGVCDVAVWCSYFYRNVASWVESPDNLGQQTLYSVYGTKPVVRTTAEAPVFKTSRHQGLRALASDSAERWGTHHMALTGPPPGRSLFAHREGYNVLYGDYSGKWYGDPQQRWAYVQLPAQYGKNGYNLGFNAVSISGGFGVCSPSYLFWHDLDVFNGVDQ